MTSQNDLKDAKKTYGGFVSTVKWTVPALFVGVILLMIIIS